MKYTVSLELYRKDKKIYIRRRLSESKSKSIFIDSTIVKGKEESSLIAYIDRYKYEDIDIEEGADKAYIKQKINQAIDKCLDSLRKDNPSLFDDLNYERWIP